MNWLALRDQQQLQRIVQRLVDLTTPNYHRLGVESRQQSRANRSLPVLLAPWDGELPQVDEAFYAVTKDLAGVGVSVVVHQPIRAQGFLLGFWDQGPIFAQAQLRHQEHLGGPFWQLGLELLRQVHPGPMPLLSSLDAKMRYLIPRRKRLLAERDRLK